MYLYICAGGQLSAALTSDKICSICSSFSLAFISMIVSVVRASVDRSQSCEQSKHKHTSFHIKSLYHNHVECILHVPFANRPSDPSPFSRFFFLFGFSAFCAENLAFHVVSGAKWKMRNTQSLWRSNLGHRVQTADIRRKEWIKEIFGIRWCDTLQSKLYTHH